MPHARGRSTGKEPDEGPPLQGYLIADRAPQHRIAGFQRIQHGTLGDRSGNLEGYLTGGG